MNRITQDNKFKTLKEQFLSVNYSRSEEVDFTTLNKRYASLTGLSTDAPFDLYQNTNTNTPYDLYLNNLLGHYQMGTSGRTFRIAEVGASALVVGNVIQSKAVDTQFTNMSVLAATVATSGVQSVTVTNGTTTVNANDFVGGSLSIYTAGTAAIAQDYIITAHTPNVTSGNSITVYLDRFLQAAWTTSAKVNMRTNPWKYVIQAPATTLTGTITGVAVFAASASTVASGATDAAPAQFTWLQTHGVGAALSDGTSILVGSGIASPSGTAGAVTLGVAGLANIGFAMQAAASGHGIGVFLQVD